MKFLFISNEGDSVDLAFKVKKEGNDVLFYVRRKQHERLYNGLLKKVDHWGEALSQDRVIVFDMVGGGKTADRLRKQGFKVFGGSEVADFLELNRSGAAEVVKAMGISAPDSVHFTSFKDATAFLKGKGKEWKRVVIKPHGNLPSDLTASPPDTEMAIRHLKWIEEKRWPEGKDVQLEIQEFVEGIEVSNEGWFSGAKFCGSPNWTMEEKKLMDGNKGPNTGCMGNVVRALDQGSKLYQSTVSKMEKFLKKPRVQEDGKWREVLPYVGPLDINSIVGEKANCLEFTARFGYDAIQAFMHLLEGDLGGLISDLAQGLTPEIKLKSGFSLAVRVSIPPYPDPEAQYKLLEGYPLEFPDKYKENYHFGDVMIEKGELVCSGSDGVPVIVADRGDDLDEVAKRVYSIVDDIPLANKQYRSDIHKRVRGDYPKLKEGGWVE